MRFVQNIINDINTLCYPLKMRLLASFLQKLVTEGMIPFVMLFLVLQEGEFLAGAIAFAILALGTFFNGYGGKAVASQNIKNALIWGEFVQFIAVLLMAVFVNSIVFILLYLLKNVIFSYLVPFGEVFVFELTTKENRAVLYQLSGLMNGLAAPLGALLGGFFYAYGLNILIYVLSAFSFLIFLLYFLVLLNYRTISWQGNRLILKPKRPQKTTNFLEFWTINQRHICCYHQFLFTVYFFL